MSETAEAPAFQRSSGLNLVPAPPPVPMTQPQPLKQPQPSLPPSTASYERVTPSALEAEQSTLGAMLIEKSAIVRAMEKVGANDFFREVHRKIFAIIVALLERNEPVDLISVVEEARRRNQLGEIGGTAYLTAIIEACPSAANVESYANAVFEQSVRRQLIADAEEVTRQAFDQSEPLSDLIESAQKKTLAVGGSANKSGFEASGSLADEFYEGLVTRAANRGKLVGLSTGFKDLDDMTNGLQKHKLYVIAAPSSVGKSTLAGNIAASVALNDHKPVLMFSTEMPAADVFERLVCSEAKVNSQSIQRGFIQAGEWQMLSEAEKRLSATPLEIFYSPGQTTFEIRSRCRKWAIEHSDPGLVVIDYLQEVRVRNERGRSMSKEEEIEAVAKECKELAGELHCPVLLVSSVNRASATRDDKRPILSDLKGSSGIEFAADLVAFLYRESYYDRPADDENGHSAPVDDTTEVIVRKQRGGATGTIKLAFSREWTRFDNFIEPTGYVPNNWGPRG